MMALFFVPHPKGASPSERVFNPSFISPDALGPDIIYFAWYT